MPFWLEKLGSLVVRPVQVAIISCREVLYAPFTLDVVTYFLLDYSLIADSGSSELFLGRKSHSLGAVAKYVPLGAWPVYTLA